MQIIANIPFFVWPVLAVLLWAGIKALKPNKVHLTVLLITPTVFFVWSAVSFFGKYTTPVAILLWLFCLSTGCLIGFMHMQRSKLQFQIQTKIVEMPASWVPLLLSMSIFTLKMTIGILSSLPNFKGFTSLFGLDLFSTVILGIFIGRGVCCLIRYRIFAKNNLVHDIRLEK